MKILQIQNLHKKYGRIHAVNNLSLEIEKGMIYGILGPNGSGKTTTLGMILDIIHPNSGQFQWFEGQFGENPRRKMGALLETPNFYPYLNQKGYLSPVVFARLNNPKRKYRKQSK